MMEPASVDAESLVRQSQLKANTTPDERLAIEDLGDVPMQMEVLLGSAALTVGQVLGLKIGAVVPLRRLAGEMSDVYLNGLSLARGEIVVIGDNLSVRIAEVTGAQPANPAESG